MGLKIILNDTSDPIEKEAIEAVNAKLKENERLYGKAYCPCQLKHTDDTVCMCKDFREMDHEGPCHCGKFRKVYAADKE